MAAVTDPQSSADPSDDLRAALARCTLCGACNAGCPTYDVALRESYGGRGRFVLSRAVLDGTLAPAEAHESLASCTRCGFCDAVCPVHVPVVALIDAARGRSEPAGATAPASPTRRRVTTDGEPVVLVVAAGETVEPDRLERRVALLARAGLAVTVVEGLEAGVTAAALGDRAALRAVAAMGLDAFEGLAGPVVVSSAAVRRAMVEAWPVGSTDPRFAALAKRVVSMAAVVSQRPLPAAVRSSWSDERVLVHVPCSDRVLGASPTPLLECLRHAGVSCQVLRGPVCCGGADPFRDAFSDLADEIARGVRAGVPAGAAIVTSDAACARHLAAGAPAGTRVGLEADVLPDLFLAASGPA